MRTTIHVKSDILKKIHKAAKRCDISPSALVIELLKNVMPDRSNNVRIGRLIQYQEREDPESWHTFHITFREDDLEFFQDMRKLFKKSLSLIVAEAVKKFIDKHHKGKSDRDNYPHTNYVIIREMFDSIISWRLIWGFPPNIAQIVEQSRNTG
jgi:hypothetical protein